MEDNEIAELWEWTTQIYPYDGTVSNREVAALIRKLVEVTTQHIHCGGINGPEHNKFSTCMCERQALEKYSIDPESFK